MALGAFGLTTNGSAADLSITTAGTTTCTAITGLTGMASCTVSLDFRYGSGGTSVKAYLQTSMDGGNTWIDIACFAVTTSSLKKAYNFSALTPVAAVTPTDGGITDNTQLDGVLGDRIRLKVVSVGTYAGATLLVGRMVAH